MAVTWSALVSSAGMPARAGGWRSRSSSVPQRMMPSMFPEVSLEELPHVALVDPRCKNSPIWASFPWRPGQEGGGKDSLWQARFLSSVHGIPEAQLADLLVSADP